MFVLLVAVSRSPLQGDNTNEQFIDLAESYYSAKISVENAESNLRNELLEPHPKNKQVLYLT